MIEDLDSVTVKFRALRERAGLSMDDLAKAMGYSRASSIQRYEDAALYKKAFIQPELILKMIKAIANKGEPPISPGEIWALARPEVTESHAAIDLKPNLVKVQATIPVRGKVAASTWMDVDEMDFGYDDMEMVPTVSSYPANLQFALEVEGNCLNKKADSGDILICLDIIGAQEDFKEGELVIVERKKYDGQMVQRTAKRVRRAAKGYELWPESTDPAHQEPIILYEAIENETVTVIGRVLWIFRKP